MKILFMCVANSARSQIAEGLARKLLGSNAQIESAGSVPTEVNPIAKQVLEEIDIDIQSQYSKSLDKLSPEFVENLDYVITLCAEEVCPYIVSKAKRLHWPMPDPVQKNASTEQQLLRFRQTRNTLHTRIQLFIKEFELN